jgi:hypothetical protein
MWRGMAWVERQRIYKREILILPAILFLVLMTPKLQFVNANATLAEQSNKRAPSRGGEEEK